MSGRPWAPGQSGNPAGRVSYKRISDALYRKLDETGETGKTNADDIAETMVTCAKKGDVQAAVFVRDTTEGRPAQQINLQADVLMETSEERKNRMLTVLTALASLQESPE